MGVRQRRLIATTIISIVLALIVGLHPENYKQVALTPYEGREVIQLSGSAAEALAELDIKGRGAKTGYSREQFGDGWAQVDGCDMRNIILARDLMYVALKDCIVLSGTLSDPYTGDEIMFVRGPSTSDDVQIDHVVALSNAWQTGAAYWDSDKRVEFANDPLELLAVDGEANQAKSDSDAATWLPPNKPFRCQYVARQVAVKHKYGLWTTQAENDAIARVLSTCPAQSLPASRVGTIVGTDG